MSPPIFTSGTTTNEGCTLHFTTIHSVDGESKKPPLILVPGGSGHGDQYLDVMPYLAKKFRPATFSRRQHGLSTPLPGAEYVYLNPAQQARDILAIADCLGFGKEKLYLFSSSGGGVITFQLAAMHPERIAHYVAHEMPCAALLPDSDKVLDFLFHVHATYLAEGSAAAYKLFLPRFPGFEGLPSLGGGAEGDEDRFLKYELLPISMFTPDLRRVRESGVSTSFAYGALSRDASYVRSTIELASVLGCQRYLVPGNHSGYRYVPEAFAGGLVKIFEDMEARERMRRVCTGF